MLSRVAIAVLTVSLPFLMASTHQHHAGRQVDMDKRRQPDGSRANETSLELEVTVTTLRAILDEAGASGESKRSRVYFPVAPGAPHSIVADTAVCSAIRAKLDSMLTWNFQANHPRPDSLRRIAALRVDTMYVAGDFDGNRVAGVTGMTVFSRHFDMLVRFR